MHCKAVILAAGSGSRLSPLTPSIPKELLPVGGFPAIHHVVYEMAEMGITDILIVLSEGKEAVRDYFTKPPVGKGETATRLTVRYEELLSRVRLSFAYQKERRGTGDAVLLAEHFMGDDDLIVAYPDDLIMMDGVGDKPPSDILSNNGVSSILARPVPRCEARNYGVILPMEVGLTDRVGVRAILEKPRDYPFDEALALVGRMRLTRDCVDEIARHPLTDSAGITLALNAMASRGALVAAVTRERVYDVGTHEGYTSTIREISRTRITDYE